MGAVALAVALGGAACGAWYTPPSRLVDGGPSPTVDAGRRDAGGRDEGPPLIDGGPVMSTLDFIEVTPSNVMVLVGGTARVRVIAHYNDGSARDVTEAALWSQPDDGFVRVDGRGGITGLAPGMAVVQVSYEGFDAALSVVIVEESAGFTLRCDPARVSLPLGTTTPQQMRLIAMMSGEEFDATSELGVEWTSTSPEVASVDALGQVLPTMRAGTTLVSGRLGDVTSPPCAVTVVEAAPAGEFTSITVTPASPRLSPGASQVLRVSANGRSSGPVDVTSMATFRVQGIAAMLGSGATANVVTGAAAGVALVTATFGTLSATVQVVVVDATLRSVRVDPAMVYLAPGGTMRMLASGTYSDGVTRVFSPGIAWASSDESLVRVDETGLATAVAGGTATITAAVFGMGTIPVVGSATVVVEPAATGELELVPISAHVRAGETYHFTLRLRSPDGTSREVTEDANATYTVVDPTVARISNEAGTRGVATGLRVGTTRVDATLSFSGRPRLVAVPTVLYVE